MKTLFVTMSAIILLSGCTRDYILDDDHLPDGATNIQHAGNGWYTFELVDGCF